MDNYAINFNNKHSKSSSVLIIDDDIHVLNSLKPTLEYIGIGQVDICSDSHTALQMITDKSYSLILLDINLQSLSGMEILTRVKDNYPDTPVVMITGQDGVETIVTFIKAGAFDYILKPIDFKRLLPIVNAAIDCTCSKYNSSNTSKLSHPEIFKNIVTQDESMIKIFSYIESIALSKQPVLITGETGTGKEYIAKAIHDSSERSGSFVPVNISGIAENLIDDDLFGHCKGAYTGALYDRKGLIEEASGGTLFLDEIGDLQPALQIKLLRVIQDNRFQKIGSNRICKCDTRIIAATNRPIKELIKKGTFRNDFYFRLSTHTVHLPPLRDRKNDIPLLVNEFLAQASLELCKKKPALPKQLYPLLNSYNFPGNIRELRSMVFDALSTHKSGTLSMESFKNKIFNENRFISETLQEIHEDSNCNIQLTGTFPTMRQIQELLINKALDITNGNQSTAAQLLGISRKTLNCRLSRADS